ncbi:MAG: acyl-CoA thioesterase II [Deltaproteobacteria bacterium]|nr:acyl-CoA thioesterase II [Deltaproteobacteria bacterium]
MKEAVDQLLELIDLEEIDENIYRGQNEKGRPGRLFGGQVAAQALAATGRTVSNQVAHSLHGYFLRPGDPAVPVVYTVDRIRDGRSFTTRRVVAQQRGRAIFNMSVSFHTPEEGYTHQFDMPDVPPPEALMSRKEHYEKLADKLPEEVIQWARRTNPIETRTARPPAFLSSEPNDEPGIVWLRAGSVLPDDPFLHQCVLTYATDLSLIDCILQPHGRMGPLGPLMLASLDHAIWFHKPLRADDWLLYHQDSPSAFGARGLARGNLYTIKGELVASVVQEALIRPVGKHHDRSE